MKIIKIAQSLLLITCLVGISACSSDTDDEIYELLYAKLLPQKTTNDLGEEVAYSYDKQDRLTKVVKKNLSTDESLTSQFSLKTYLIHYSTQTNNIDSLIVNTLYYSDLSGKVDTILLNSDTVTYEYENMMVKATSNKIARTIKIDTGKRVTYRDYTSNDYTKTYDYEYDTNGNISKYIENKDDVTEQSTTYEYDDKKGIFKNVKTDQWLLVDVLELYSGFANNYVKNSIGSRTYTYSKNNYPRTIKTDQLPLASVLHETISYIQSNYYGD